jgi:cell division protein FtsB
MAKHPFVAWYNIQAKCIKKQKFMSSLSLTSFRHIQDKLVPYLTVQYLGLAFAGVIALTWMWGSVQTLQKNYQHQRSVDANNQKIELMKLQNQNLGYQKAYFNSSEFLELEARERLGLGYPGEKLVILPSSRGIVDTAPEASIATKPSVIEKSNFAKWMDFFFRRRGV